MTRRVIGVYLALAALASAAVGVTAYTVRWDDPAAPNQQPFMEGFLTYQGGAPGIAWEPAAGGDDVGPPHPDPANAAKRADDFRYDRHSNLATCTGGVAGTSVAYVGTSCTYTYPYTAGTQTAAPYPDTVFTSGPLPKNVHVNVTRGFQITLFLQKNPESKTNAGAVHTPCANKLDYYPSRDLYQSQFSWKEPSLDLELYANDRLIGGAYYSDAMSWFSVFPNRKVPDNPEGFGACYFQMHSETQLLEAGTVLKLKVQHARQEYWYPIGLKGDHRSSIRVWEYPIEELLFRNPDLEETFNPTSEEGDEGEGGAKVAGADSVDVAAPAAGLGLLGLVSVRLGRTRRGIASLLLGVLVASALAGCLTSSKKEAENAEVLGGKVENTFIQDPSGGGVGTGLSVLGVVHDDIHVPLKGVHVSIIGLANFTTTDSKGTFRFFGLLPGIYKLRFDKDEYKSFEADVEVKVGFVSKPDITMVLKNAKEADFRPHSHNYWGGADTKNLGTFKNVETCTTDAAGTVKCTPPPPTTAFRIAPKDEESDAILPGTDEVEVRFAWDPAKLKADKLGLVVYSNQGNYSAFAPRAPNQPFRVRTTWEMTDVGHMKYSTWLFHYINPLTQLRTFEEEQATRQANYHWGDIAITISIHKGGALPLEPAHPDPWGGKTSIKNVGPVKYQPYYSGYLPPSYPRVCSPAGVITCTTYPPTYYSIGFGKNLVPYDAKTVEVTVVFAKKPEPDYSLQIWYKPANVPSWAASVSTLANYKKVDPQPGSTWEKMVFRIQLKPIEGDQEYAKSSAWTLTYRLTNYDAAWQEYFVYVNTEQNLLGIPYQSFTIDVTTYKDAVK